MHGSRINFNPHNDIEMDSQAVPVVSEGNLFTVHGGLEIGHFHNGGVNNVGKTEPARSPLLRY